LQFLLETDTAEPTELYQREHVELLFSTIGAPFLNSNPIIWLLPSWFNAASSLTSLIDHPRKGEKLTLSPSGTLAAITDSLGRILLLDTQALVVVRLWKVCIWTFLPQPPLSSQKELSKWNLVFLQGYRDASCLFMEMLVSKDIASSSSSYSEPSKSDYCLCLAIHAPRKGIIEVSLFPRITSELQIFISLIKLLEG